MSKEVKHKMTRRGNLLVGEALRAVCVTVANDHCKLKVLADVLLKSVETTTLGKELMEDYCKYRPFTFINQIIVIIVFTKIINFLIQKNNFKLMKSHQLQNTHIFQV